MAKEIRKMMVQVGGVALEMTAEQARRLGKALWHLDIEKKTWPYDATETATPEYAMQFDENVGTVTVNL